MATYKYRQGGGTDSIPKKSYEMGGMEAPSIEERVEEVKAKILEALEGGATDQEINMIVRESGLEDKYEFNWDSVEMKVEARPIKGEGDRGKGDMGGGIEALMSKLKGARSAAEDRFGPKDAPGQRGDMFEQGGRTYAGQYMGKIMQDEGGKYAMYDDGEGNKTKAYFMEDPGQVGEFVPDNDYLFESRDGKTFARLAEGFEDQRNPKERQIGKEVMEESTKGASKIENLLEKLQDMGRKSAGGRKTYRYEQGGVTDDPKPPSWIANDPRFQNVQFVGSNYESKMNRASGFGGADFRYDLKGVKFYGFDDDGFTFIDENGNAFEAERTTDQGGMFDYIKGMGAQFSDEYADIVSKATKEKEAEPKGPVGTIIHKNGIITGSGDPRGEIIDLREGRRNLPQRELRRGLKQLMNE